MTTATFHILLALAEGDKHGYAIMQEVERLTAGKLRIGPGTLYAALERLAADAWIEECPAADERRRYYRLTREGRKAAAEEAGRLRELVETALQRRLLRHA